MAYTQWAAAHGYWDIVIRACVLVCLNVQHVCVSIHVCVYLTYLLYRMCEQWRASFACLCLCLCLCICVCLFLPLCVFVCVHERKTVALWPVDAVLFALTACPVLSQSVTQWFPAPHSSRPAASRTHCSI